MNIHHTYTRVAHRHDRREPLRRSFGGNPDTGLSWHINRDDYICASGLCRHFDIPADMNELEVQVIVADSRPDPEAQRLFSYSGESGLRIEREWGPLEKNAAHHTLHHRFSLHVQTAMRAARKLESKVWMLCLYKRVAGGSEAVTKDCGERPIW